MKMNAKSFHDGVGWSRVLERRPPDRKTSMQWEKITKSQCQKSVPQWHDFFKKNNKNNTEFLGAEKNRVRIKMRIKNIEQHTLNIRISL